MRLNPIVPLLALFLLVSGCSANQKMLLYTPENMVPDGLGYDQSMRDHIAKLEKGPIVEGRSCSWLDISNEDISRTINNAYGEAIRKAGPRYDALTNMELTSSFYPFFFSCKYVRGTAAKNETYYAAPNNKRGIDKQKGELK